MPKITADQRAAARQRLIDATIAVAERDGIDGLTTRAITAEAGVSPGMFYGHFDSKESLLAAVVDDRVDQLTTLLAAEMDLGAAPLSDIVREVLHELIEVADLRALAAFRAAASSEEARATQRRINGRIVEAFAPIVQITIDAGLVRPDVDAEAVVELIDMLIDGLNRRRATDGFVTSDRRVSAVVTAAIENFMLATEGDPTS